MRQNLFLSVDEVTENLGVSKPMAYKLIREMNDELKERGFITIAGKISRRYFEEKVYGGEHLNTRGETK
jgi:hypothetical protein